MSQQAATIGQRVRFEEVTPANEYAAFFNASLESLVADLGLPIYESYDDLDDLRLAFFTLQSGETVTLGEYLNSPQPGTSLYVDSTMENIPQIVFDSCQQLQVSRQEVVWFHPDFQEDIEGLYASHGEIRQNRRDTKEQDRESSQVKVLPHSSQYEPIDCFHHALQIYTRQDFPLYWAMLQHNLGLAYCDRIQGNLIKNLQRSIECFQYSLEIYTQDKFPEKWEINQHDLKKSHQLMKSLFSTSIP